MGWNRPAFKYMVLELHYDNADQDAGVIDNSGSFIYFLSYLVLFLLLMEFYFNLFIIYFHRIYNLLHQKFKKI